MWFYIILSTYLFFDFVLIPFFIGRKIVNKTKESLDKYEKQELENPFEDIDVSK